MFERAGRFAASTCRLTKLRKWTATRCTKLFWRCKFKWFEIVNSWQWTQDRENDHFCNVKSWPSGITSHCITVRRQVRCSSFVVGAASGVLLDLAAHEAAALAPELGDENSFWNGQTKRYDDSLCLLKLCEGQVEKIAQNKRMRRDLFLEVILNLWLKTNSTCSEMFVCDRYHMVNVLVLTLEDSFPSCRIEPGSEPGVHPKVLSHGSGAAWKAATCWI